MVSTLEQMHVPNDEIIQLRTQFMAWRRMGLNFYLKNLSDIYNWTKIIETHCLEFISDDC